jgi:NAD(P)-dependent dehydrogenase (short-subunit alcohol dehydrogenase family)
MNEKILSRIPYGAWAKPQDLAGAAIFLASPASDYCCGFDYVVDGGVRSTCASFIALIFAAVARTLSAISDHACS